MNRLAMKSPILHCLSCSGVTSSNIDQCITLVECAHECYVNTTTLSTGTKAKKFGCAEKPACLSAQGVIGKRDVTSYNTEFCPKEICNTDVDHFQEPPHTPCGDVSETDCRDPAALASICSDCETAQYCRKSCGLCRDRSNSWYENVVLFDFDPVHRTCRHSAGVSASICQSIKEQYYRVLPVVKNNYTVNHAHARHDYLILAETNSYVSITFKTNGEPLTNLQLSACKTINGLGRVDILLNNHAIQEAYNGTFGADLRWQIHKLDTNQFLNDRNFTLLIRKDSRNLSYGHYWLSRIRLESVVAHHGHHGK
ncbi:uncharacterized protein LOC133191288 [Saccostrea echinata]|uniref:uncharacterized protein LOC133191288 n=1 Tax=Saccostrea echinata TaxID=191078 RepID=UPI002A8282C8|nr:uncharacterized protein LOC133191288 [Saccostrea echinata]